MPTFPIYAIDRDNGDGRYVRRYSFAPFAGPVNIMDESRDLILCQDTDGGEVGVIVAPDGATLATYLDCDDCDVLMLVVPDSDPMEADEAYSAATARRPWLRSGLRWQSSPRPAQPRITTGA